ncbi:MAG: hypothetical protein QHC89_02875, partial [Bosea sp. (in: a-proteobacteria)]|nr:hypothetical protein [Bosea sp. (in: a-proteobacteria)]
MSLVKSLASAGLLLMMATAVPAHAEGGVRDLEREEANRKLVVEFYDRVFNRHQVEEGASVLVESYRQHNPAVPDGKAPFV